MPSLNELASLGLPISQPESSTPPSGQALSHSSAAAALLALTESHGSTSSAASVATFSLGHGFPLIPTKLVEKIHSWQYIGMAELLPDNLELACRSAESVGTSSCSSWPIQRRELTHDQGGLLAWSVCFCTYAAIVGQKYPLKLKELLAYHATIVIEALRFNGRGWLPYDKMFREHVAKHPDTDWAQINPIFYSLSYLSQKMEGPARSVWGLITLGKSVLSALWSILCSLL